MKKTKSKKQPAQPLFDMPPVAFSNAMNELMPGFNFQNWRTSSFWAIYLTGYHAALDHTIDLVREQISMSKHKDEKQKEFKKTTPLVSYAKQYRTREMDYTC